MSNALQLRDATIIGEWQILREQATMLVKTNFLPQAIKTPEQAIAIILTGRELGIGTMAALNNINVIAGKPTVSPQLMLALINSSKELEDVSITDNGNACAVTMKRRGRKPHTETFSMEDAARMRTTEGYGDSKKTISLSEKYNWKQQPATMRKWRAVAACARVVFPDIILGLYTPDELGATIDGETGEVIEMPAERLNVAPVQTTPVVELVSTDTRDAIENLWPQVGATLKGQKVTLSVWLAKEKGVDHPSQMPRELGEKLLGWLQDKALKLSEPAQAEEPKAGLPQARDPRPKTLNDLVTPKQLWMIRNLAHEAGLDAEQECLEQFQLNLEEISKNAATSLIDHLKRERAAVEEPKANQGAGLDQWLCTQETGSRVLAMEVLTATRRLEATGVTVEQWRAELNDVFASHELPVSRKKLSAEDLREQWLPLLVAWAAKREEKKSTAPSSAL